MDVDGVIPPMLTPTTESAEIDEEALKDFTRYLTEGGVHGLFPMGTSGEFASFSSDQQQTVTRIVVEESGDLPVLAGCGGTSIRDVETRVANAAEAGADAGVVVTPYYFESSQQSLSQFYREIASTVSIPIYLYNIPDLTGNNLEPETVEELAEHPNIAGIKDSSGDFPYFLEVLETTPDSLDVLQGIPTYAVLSLEHGADGLVAGSANIFPEAVSEVFTAYSAGDFARAREIHSKVLLPVMRELRTSPTVGTLKYLAAKVGQDLGDPILPATQLTSEQKRSLDACLERIVQTGVTAVGQETV